MNDMRTYMDLIESAEQLDEINFKKAAATAGMIGALAGSPMDTQASTDAAQGIDTNQPVATQQVDEPESQPQEQELVDNLYVGMSIEQVLESVPGAKTSKGSGLSRWYGVHKKSIKVKSKGTEYEFDANDKLVGVHKLITMRKTLIGAKPNPEYKALKLSGWGYRNEEFKSIFTQVYKVAEPRVGSATGKVETSNGVKFGLGLGALTSKGIFMIGLDKVGSASATVPTTNGSLTLLSQTQSGVRNSFTPSLIIESYHATRAPSELEF